MKSCHNESSHFGAHLPVLRDEKKCTYHFAHTFLEVTLESL